MMGTFTAVEVIGSDKDVIPKRPWFADLEGVDGFAGVYTEGNSSFVGKVFAGEQAVLDTIGADNRTEFAFPLAIKGGGIRWADENTNVGSTTRDKVVAWLAAHSLKSLPRGANKPDQLARHVMKEVTTVAHVDALESFRIYWS